MSWIDTREAGGGSYPEPPCYPEPPQKECDHCYNTNDLSVIDGLILCPDCKARYVFDHADYEDYMAYIKDNFEEQVAFYLRFYFDELDDFEKLYAAKKHFEQTTDEEDKLYYARNYMLSYRREFAEFMEGKN